MDEPALRLLRALTRRQPSSTPHSPPPVRPPTQTHLVLIGERCTVSFHSRPEYKFCATLHFDFSGCFVAVYVLRMLPTKKKEPTRHLLYITPSCTANESDKNEINPAFQSTILTVNPTELRSPFQLTLAFSSNSCALPNNKPYVYS
jgi:hypothetical protein